MFKGTVVSVLMHLRPIFISITEFDEGLHLIECFYRFSPKTDIKSYQIFGAIVLEVEVDILTGEHRVRKQF